MDPISIDDVKKVEITVSEILSAERIEGSDKLLKLSVDFGSSPEPPVASIIAWLSRPIMVRGARLVTNG